MQNNFWKWNIGVIISAKEFNYYNSYIGTKGLQDSTHGCLVYQKVKGPTLSSK